MHSVTDYGHDLEFGVFVTPSAEAAERVVALAMLADRAGLDLVTFQDHPYQARFLDTWTLLSFVAARTSRIRVAPNVLNLPLRKLGIIVQHVNEDPDRPAKFVAAEPNLVHSASVDRGSGFEQIEDAPEYKR